MDGWGPHFTITVVVFACYVLLAVFGSWERGEHRPSVIPARHRLLRERYGVRPGPPRNS